MDLAAKAALLLSALSSLVAVVTLLRTGREWKVSRLQNEKLVLEIAKLKAVASQQREKLELEIRQLRGAVAESDRRIVRPSDDQLREIENGLGRLMAVSAQSVDLVEVALDRGRNLIQLASENFRQEVDGFGTSLQKEIRIELRRLLDPLREAVSQTGRDVQGMRERLGAVEEAIKKKRGITW